MIAFLVEAKQFDCLLWYVQQLNEKESHQQMFCKMNASHTKNEISIFGSYIAMRAGNTSNVVLFVRG